MDQIVIAACFGLARVCAANTKTPDTEKILMDVLHSENDPQQLTALIHEEKDKISPGCKLCQSRCGNTDDIFVEMKEDSFMKKSFDLCLLFEGRSAAIRGSSRRSSFRYSGIRSRVTRIACGNRKAFMEESNRTGKL